MATVSQIQRGFVMFVDREVAASFEGWQRVLVAGTAGLLAANLPNTMKVYGSNPIVAALGVYDPQSGTVNIDALYNAFVPKLGNDKIPIPIPRIGTIRLGQPEIDLLMRYIKEA